MGPRVLTNTNYARIVIHMTTLVTARAVSLAPPAHFFALWVDVATWTDWNTDTEWVRLDGPFVQGATGKLKPKGGPAVDFTVEKLTETDFVDVSRLWGARLVFDHHITRTPSGTEIVIEVRLTGPLSAVWNLILGKGIKASAPADLAGLVAAAEARVSAGR